MIPVVSIVIPTYNRARYLARVLTSLKEQDTSAGTFEVVVTDDGSTDDTASVLGRDYGYPLVCITQPNAGPAAARNAAVERAAAELVVFIDDDVIPARDLVRRHVEAQRAAPGVIIGRMLMPDNAEQPVWAEWEGRTVTRQYDQMAAGIFVPTPRQFYTANASVRREDLIRAGLFDTTFRRAEDVELGYRLSDLGLPFRFVQEAIVTHDTPRTLEGWMRMAEQYGHYDIVMWRERGRTQILGNIAEEFHLYRKRALQLAARIAVGRPAAMLAARFLGRGLIRGLDAVGLRKAALAACSLTFNLMYLNAVCSALGGRTEFWGAMQREMAMLDLSPEAGAGQ